jgi:hypothetical protein
MALFLAGCFADATQLTGGNNCQSGPGWYCGYDGVPGIPRHLYYCPLAATTTSSAIDLGLCPEGACNASAGGNDYCRGGVSRSTMLGYPSYGWWCGENFSGGATGHLYFFDDNFGTDLGVCRAGCIIAAMGTPDYCR